MGTVQIDELLTVSNAARALGIKTETLRNWLCQRRIGFTRIGTRNVRIPLSEVQRLQVTGFVAPLPVEKRR